MLYHLLVPLAKEYSFLNIFTYISFRAVGAAVTALLMAFIVGPMILSQLRKRAAAHRIADDIEGADLSGVTGTPTFFVNGRRHYGAYDIATLSAAVRQAGARATLGTATTD